MKESHLWKQHLQPILTQNGFIAVRMAFNGTGQTDAFAFLHPHYFGIELKTLTAKTDDGCYAELSRKHTRAQRLWREKVTASGGIHLLLGSRGANDIFCITSSSIRSIQDSIIKSQDIKLSLLSLFARHYRGLVLIPKRNEVN